LAYSSLQADYNVKFAAWSAGWQPLGADRFSLRGPKVNSIYGFTLYMIALWIWSCYYYYYCCCWRA